MSTLLPTYTANGLSSGLNDTAIIQSLVAAQQAPIQLLQSQQSALQTEISAVGTIASNLQALQTAVANLGSSGAVAAKVLSNNTAFTATAGTQASLGQYSIQVTSVASAAKARSVGFVPAGTVTGGVLHVTVQGTNYDISIADGANLQAVAQAINGSGAPVSASVVSDGVNQYIQITASASGFPIGSSPSSALSITESDTGTQGQPLGFTIAQPATNAAVMVDGLSVTSQSNSISTAIPGVTLNLTAKDSAPENLVIGTDSAGTTQNLQAFVTAYNALNGEIQNQLQAAASSSMGTASNVPPLAGDGTLRALESQLQGVVTATVAGVAGFNSLASIGISSDPHTGQLSIDQGLLSSAVAANPGAVNQLFSQATTGISASLTSLATAFADPATGALIQDSKNLTTRSSAMGQQVTRLQDRATQYQITLQNQFAAMESVVSGFKNVGNFLNAQAAVMYSKAGG